MFSSLFMKKVAIKIHQRAAFHINPLPTQNVEAAAGLSTYYCSKYSDMLWKELKSPNSEMSPHQLHVLWSNVTAAWAVFVLKYH